MFKGYLIILSLALSSSLLGLKQMVAEKYINVESLLTDLYDTHNFHEVNNAFSLFDLFEYSNMEIGGNENEELAFRAPDCSELFISEYVEGTFENKFIELYNPTSSVITLVNYALEIYNNGSNTPNYVINLTGAIAPFDVFVIADPDETFALIPDQTTNNLSFNGNDVIALTKSGIIIDVIGQLGIDPGAAWTGSGCSTQNRTLVRSGNIKSGDTAGNDSFDPSIEWICYAVDEPTYLGAHVSDCEFPAPELQLVDNLAINQNCGYIMDFGNVISNGGTIDLTFTIENKGSADLHLGSFDITGDYSTVSPTAPLTIGAGDFQLVTVRFMPTTNGVLNGVFTITNNDSDEGSCVVNLTGTGYTPAPEIDIERNNFASISNGNTANTGNNTIFAITEVGGSTSAKTFYIRNEGTADLKINSIMSSNNTEFPLTLISPLPLNAPPPFYIMSPGDLVEFEIIFSPNSIGVTSSTITVISDDSNENPYIFEVQGNGACAASNISISPSSGPIGTTVTITGGTSFGASTLATLNGVSATILPGGTLTTIDLLVPNGASTGSIKVIDDNGCISSQFFMIMDGAISSCEGSTTTFPSNLFISEVTDKGTGSHSYVEIYNGRNNVINLNNYELRIHNNGAVLPTTTIPLSGTIPSKGIIVVAFGSINANDPEGGYVADFFSGGSGINEDDHIRLYEGSSWVDLWGDPSGNPFTIASKNYTYRRKNSGISAPSIFWNSLDWFSFTPVNYSNIGVFDFSLGSPPSINSGPDFNMNCSTASISITGLEGFIGGKALTYQWYFSAPGDTSWTMVPDNIIYDNVTSSTLNILNTFAVINYQYYCQVRENDNLCFTASNAVKYKIPTTTWTSSGWTNSGPTSNTMTTLDYAYNTVIDGSFNACNLVINTGVILDVGDATYIQVGKNVINNGMIELRTKGAFVQNGIGGMAGIFTNNGITRVRKSTATIMTDIGSSHIYTYWSSPLEFSDLSTVFPTPTGNRRYYFEAKNFLDQHSVGTTNGIPDDIDDDNNDWQNATGNMELAKGYAVTSSPPIGFPFSDQATFENIGLGGLNTGDYMTKVYRNNLELNDVNWNLIGNPYPSAIGFDKFMAENSNILDGVIYLWSHATPESAANPGNQVFNYAQDDYAVINFAGGIAGGSTVIPEKFITSGQGFFVSYKNSGLTSICTGLPLNVECGEVIFTNEMRMGDTTSNQQFFELNDESQIVSTSNRIWINLTSDNGVFNQILVAYMEGATDADDGMSYDARRNLSSENASNIYTMINRNEDLKYAIQSKYPGSLTIEEVIPIGFKTIIDEATIYTLSIAKMEGPFFSENKIYLRDKLMSKTHILSETDYDFTSAVGEFNNRFEIVYHNDLLSNVNEIINGRNLSIKELQDHKVSFSISGNLLFNKIEIFDVLGRKLLQIQVDGQEHIENLSNFNSASYIAQVTLNIGAVVSKIFIKQ